MTGIGLLGTGFMGKAHTQAYRSIPVYMEDIQPRLVAIYSRFLEKAKRFASIYGYSKYYDNWAKLVRDREVEVVDNSLPNFLHRDPCILVAEEGKPIICEKPLARSLDEALDMVRAVEKYSVVNGVIFNKRWLPSIRLAKKLIEEGVIGKVSHFRFAYHQDWGLRNTTMSWRFKKELAGYGVLGDQGSHVIDMIRFLIGEISKVFGRSKVSLERRINEKGEKVDVDVEDIIVIIVEMKNGSLGTIEVSRSSLGRKNYFTFEIYGEEGALHFDMERLNELWVYTKGAPEVEGFRRVLVTEREHPFYKYFWPPGHTIGWVESFTLQLYHFLKSVEKGIEYSPNFRDGAIVNAVMDAIYESLRRGKFMKINL